MALTLLDWAIVAAGIAALGIICLTTSRYMNSVAGFLVANRLAGRYLLCVSRGMSGVGAVSLLAFFEMHAEAGFAPIWWEMIRSPVLMIIFLSGWIYYRFRETRCLTVSQFYEVRYSRATRVYAAIVVWIGGLLSFGLFPAIEANLLVHFMGLPETLVWLEGAVVFGISISEIPTYVPIMVITLIIAVFFACAGGQITIMITDCIQGLFADIVILVVAIFLLCCFTWVDLSAVFEAAPTGQSLTDPYDTAEIPDFNMWFYLIVIFATFYTYMSWQGTQSYQASGLTPHEQKMGNVIAIWRQVPLTLIMVLIPVCMMVVMKQPAYAEEGDAIHRSLGVIENEALRNQMAVPVALSYMLPTGLRGLFCVVFLLLLITTQNTLVHAWGSVLVQDIVLPLRRKSLSTKAHVNLLRLAIVGVACFAVVFGIVYRQTEQIMMFIAITSAIISGAGAVMIGGLYWSRGTSLAAIITMTLGWVLAVGRIAMQQLFPMAEGVDRESISAGMQWIVWLNETNSQWVWLWIMLACIVCYVMVSLLTCREPIDMDRVLHRGRYARVDDHMVGVNEQPSLWRRLAGITAEFTRNDRLLAYSVIFWTLGWFALFVIGTFVDFMIGIDSELWWRFWYGWLWMNTLLSVPIVIWILFGATRDLRRLFIRLHDVKDNPLDDGRVVSGQNLDDLKIEKKRI